MKKKIIISLLFAMPLMAAAQSLKPTKATISVGTVVFEHPVTATFSLRNVAKKPITITGIDTGCGCTTASYPKGVIPANKTFQIKVTYDSKLLGHFIKPIFIYDDVTTQPTKITMKGLVASPGDAAAMTPELSGIAIGSLLANENYVEFDDVHKGEILVRELTITNPTPDYVEPVIMRLPAYLTATITPQRLAPNESATVRLTLDSKQLHSLGLNQTNIYLGANVGEKISEDKAINVSAVLLPEQVAEDDASRSFGPNIELSSTTVDMKNFNGKKKLKREIIIKNTGKSYLTISSMQLFTSGLEVTLDKRQIAPGQKTKLKITGIADILKKVRNRPRVLMITNDPDNQKIEIEVER